VKEEPGDERSSALERTCMLERGVPENELEQQRETLADAATTADADAALAGETAVATSVDIGVGIRRRRLECQERLDGTQRFGHSRSPLSIVSADCQRELCLRRIKERVEGGAERGPGCVSERSISEPSERLCRRLHDSHASSS
jgi:hypothetical protein